MSGVSKSSVTWLPKLASAGTALWPTDVGTWRWQAPPAGSSAAAWRVSSPHTPQHLQLAPGHSPLHSDSAMSNCSNCRAAQPAPSSRCTRAADRWCCAICPASLATAGPHPAPAGWASRSAGSRACKGGAWRSAGWRCSGGSRGSRTEAQAAAPALPGWQGRARGGGGGGSSQVCTLCRFGEGFIEAAVDGSRVCLMMLLNAK